MYSPGKIIYFDPFHFKDGSSKPKYFLVLKIFNGNAILASLPSSKFHLPQNQSIKHGCLEIKDACISCYIFEAKVPITKTGWFFELNTFLYAQWVDEFIIEELSNHYPLSGIDYEIIGELKDDELKKIIQCFYNSNVIKRKYKRILTI